MAGVGEAEAATPTRSAAPRASRAALADMVLMFIGASVPPAGSLAQLCHRPEESNHEQNAE
jgi:hypothetical protein